MSKRAEAFAAMRHVADTAKLLLGGSVDIEALRQAVALWDAFRPLPYRRRIALSGRGGEGGGVSAVEVTESQTSIGTSEGETILKEIPNVSAKSSAKSPSWLGRFAAEWRSRFGEGSQPPWGAMGRALKPLIAECGIDEVRKRWANYLVSAEARYASPQRFAMTFGAWVTSHPDAWKYDPTEFRPGESHEAYIRRQVRGGR